MTLRLGAVHLNDVRQYENNPKKEMCHENATKL